MKENEMYREFEEKWKERGGSDATHLYALVCVEAVVALLAGGLPMLFMGVNTATALSSVAWGAVALGLAVVAAVMRRRRAREREAAWREYQRLHQGDG